MPQAEEKPVARVAVDVSLSHLDRPFDYRVLASQDEQAVPGARVRVRFAGKLRDGYILDRVDETDHDGTLAPLHKIISAEPVLTPQVTRLIRRVADHYAGCFADVLRLAVPPRHAATEAEPRRKQSTSTDEATPDEPIEGESARGSSFPEPVEGQATSHPAPTEGESARGSTFPEPVEGQTTSHPSAPEGPDFWSAFPDGPGLLHRPPRRPQPPSGLATDPEHGSERRLGDRLRHRGGGHDRRRPGRDHDRPGHS